MLYNKYWLDEIYYATIVNPIKNMSDTFLWRMTDVKIIDGIVNGTAKIIFNIGNYLKIIQSGVAQNYAIIMITGIILIIGWFIF